MPDHPQGGPAGHPANDTEPTGPDREAAIITRGLSWRRRASVRTTPFRPTRRAPNVGA